MGDIQGGGDSDEKPVHRVSVGEFAMGMYEVTVGEFSKFVNSSGYRTDAEKEDSCWIYRDSWKSVKGVNWRNPNFYQNNNHPVTCISWNDAVAYTKWLSNQTGKQYRLPTEAEWEYAARAGTETARYWGNDPDLACSYANVHDNTSKEKNGFSWTHHKCTDGYAKTAPSGSFEANKFGLFDMLGNLWEWSCSQYEDKYNGKEKVCFTKNSNKYRVLRGGSWNSYPRYVRTAGRSGPTPDFRSGYFGFRVVLAAAWTK
jgi:formylglycine-generating enzyme required for sulfatase activity